MTIFGALKSSVEQNPSKEAVFFYDDGAYRSLTYRELFHRIGRLAQYLQTHGIKKESHVGLIMHNSTSWIEAFFACAQLGAIIVPVNPALNEEEINYLLSHAEIKTIFTDEKSLPALQPIARAHAIAILSLDSAEEKNKIEHCKAKNDYEHTAATDTCCIIYTSGTTGKPKGVLLSHQNFLANIDSIKKLEFITPRDRLICLLPFYHAYPLTASLLLSLLLGASLSLPENLDSQSMLECVRETKITIFIGVPRIFQLLKERVEKEMISLPTHKKILLSALLGPAAALRSGLRINALPFLLKNLHEKLGPNIRYFISGGAHLDEECARQFFRWGFTILEGYGLTETAPVISFNAPARWKIGSTGRPLSGVSVKINSPDTFGTGEIIVKGANVTSGYYKDKALTEQRIQNGWFSTGDLGRIDRDGFLFVHQRKDDVIVLNSGKKVNPEEIESYYGQSPFIKEIGVFFQKGQAEILSALIRPDYEHMQAQQVYQIRDRVRWEIEKASLSLPAYKRIGNYRIISEPLARTELGKLKRFQLPETWQAADPEKTKTPQLSTEDQELLTDPLCKKAYDFLCQEAKRSVSLSDDLEIDLGFDSLQQITLLAEFESIAGEMSFSEQDLALLRTVRGVLKKIKLNSGGAGTEAQKAPAQSWQERLSQPLKETARREIRTSQDIFEKIANLFFILSFRLLFLILFRVEVKGSKNIPRSQPVILCPNHASYLDGPLLFCCLPIGIILNTFFVGYKAYFNHPAVSWARKLLRFISIEPNMEAAENLQMCIHALTNKKNICIFPEGRRSLDGKLQPFKKGIGILIKEAGVDIVPVYIKGAFNAWPPYRNLPRPHKVSIHIGTPVSLQELSASGKETTEPIDNYANIMHNLSVRLGTLERTSI